MSMNECDSVIDNQNAVLFAKYQSNHSQKLDSREIKMQGVWG